MYRTPSDIVEDLTTFREEFSTLLTNMKAMKHSCYVCGDYNINLLKVKTNKHYCEYFDEVISQGFIPEITLPIRISEKSSTLIDNIYTCNMSKNESSGILWNQISPVEIYFTINTIIENLSYVIRVPKFIEIEKNDPRSI